MCSIPTETRIRSALTPDGLLLGSSVSCWWVVVAGWITRVLASPTLARWLASSTRVDERAAGLRAALDAEGEHRPEAVVQVALGPFVDGMVRRGPGSSPKPLRVRLQPARQLQGVVHVALHPQREGLQALQQQERVERAQARAEVAQPFDPGPDGEGDVAERAVGPKASAKPRPWYPATAR